MEAAMRSRTTLKMVLMLAGAAAVLSACAADPDYDSSQFAYGYPVYQDPPYGYPTYGYFDFDYWGGDWHRHDHWHGGHH
jgi:opacity protein-like surface antigen